MGAVVALAVAAGWLAAVTCAAVAWSKLSDPKPIWRPDLFGWAGIVVAGLGAPMLLELAGLAPVQTSGLVIGAQQVLFVAGFVGIVRLVRQLKSAVFREQRQRCGR